MTGTESTTERRPNVGTTWVEARTGRITVPAKRYTARIGRETLMRKDGHPRTFKTKKAAMTAAQRHVDATPN